LNRVLERIHAASGADVGSDAHVLATLRRSAEGLKIRLTYAELAELEIDMGGARPLEFRLSREELDELIRPDVERTMRSVEAALRDAELGRGQIDGILLVGGSTRIPLVRRLLEERFGMEPRSGVNPDLAVALGAATQAGILAGSEQELLLLDVVPLSLGLETLGGAFSKLILRNATLPCSVTEEFSTQADNQTGIDLNIYQGERELIQDCRQIASFKLSGIPPMPAGLARVAVTFAIDANGLLRVTARELRSGQTASVEVEPTLGLGKDEVRELVSESIQKAEEDFVARELLELRNSARALVRGTRQVLARGGADGLAPEQSYAIRKALAKLDGLEETGEGRELHEAVERLSSLTVQLADDMIGASVRKALEGSAVSEEERHGR
ncbi:MAG: Hsp70 family protein, partial [Planctomycetota bacterium]